MKTSILITLSQLFISDIVVAAEDTNIHEQSERRIENNRANRQGGGGGGGVRVGRNNQGQNNNAASIATTENEDDDNWWKDDEDELYNPAVEARAQRGRTGGRQKATTSVNDMGFGAQSDNSQPNQQPTRQSRNGSSEGIDPSKIARPNRAKQSVTTTSDVNVNKVLQSNNVQVAKGPRKNEDNKKNKKAMNNQKVSRQSQDLVYLFAFLQYTYVHGILCLS